MLNRGQAVHWTAERLRRTVRRLVGEGILEVSLLDRARTQPSDDRLVRLVAGIKAAAPDRTLQQIAAQLEAMRTDAARWNPLASLLRQALAGPSRTARLDRKRDSAAAIRTSTAGLSSDAAQSKQVQAEAGHRVLSPQKHRNTSNCFSVSTHR